MASLYSDEYEALIEKVIDARKLAGITQVELAKALGRPQSFISKYEAGERRLDPVEYIKIMLVLGADPLQALASFVKGKRS